MKRQTVYVLFGVMLAVATSVRCEPGAIDNVPAATLLLPYFEVDLNNPNGVTTLFTVTNSGSARDNNSAIFPNQATAVLAHVTLWTDLGIPTIAFDVYFTGFDVQAVNLRDVFDGNLPRTATAGQDPSDTISNHGPISQDINFASCNGILPYTNPALTADQITGLRNAHTGAASSLTSDLCSGFNHGDNIARGYVTIDLVNQCNAVATGNPEDPFVPDFFKFPGSSGYFVSGGAGIATNQNLLTGDFLFIDSANNFASGENLVALEAIRPSTNPAFGTAGNHTFYGRVVNGTASDNRESLTGRWAAPYVDGGNFSYGSELLVWRDPVTSVAPFACASVFPSPYPLGQNSITAFDTEENPTTVSGGPFRIAAQRVRIGADLAIPARSGWLNLDLNNSGAIPGSPFTNNSARQSYVISLRSSQGRFSSSHQAIALDAAFTQPSIPD